METDKLKRISQILDIERSTRAYLYEKNKAIQDRDIDCLIHPSSIGYCTRKLQYHYIGERPVHKIGSQTRSIFDQGHAIHDLLQERLENVLQYISTSSFEKLDLTLEVEKSINNTSFAEELELAGSADGLITMGVQDTTYTIIYEAKSISSKGWEKLSSPLLKHRLQTAIYAKAFEADAVLFEYFCKNSSISKWFLIEPDAEALETAINQIQKVRSYTRSLRLIPHEGSTYECRECAYLETCKPPGVPL